MTEVDEGLREAVLAACTQPGMIRAHFQPIVDLARGAVTGYEALARFAGPPQASPDKWFAAAHRAGVGERLEARALQIALDGRAALPLNCFLTVNVGPKAILSAPARDVLDAAGDLRGVVIEITEQSPVDDYDELNAVLAPYRSRGALIAIDDAGAGYASLQHIASLEPSLIKIDRALVAGVDTDPVKAAVVEMMGLFASRIDAWVLAEGVETMSELERLLALNVPLAQGYGLGRPAPAMSGPTPESVELCRRHTQGLQQSDLAVLAEACPTAPENATEAEVAAALLRQPAARWAVLLDEFGRPTRLVSRGGAVASRRQVRALCVLPSEDLLDVVRRIATRPADERLAPIALCDEEWRLIGVIPIERILERLADLADGGLGGGSAAQASAG